MSTPNPILSAAAPELVIVLQALQQFLTNIGTDQTKFAITLPGALQVFLGTAELQLPALAGAEVGAVQTAANARIASWITQLQSKV
jgi:hypothetical protein